MRAFLFFPVFLFGAAAVFAEPALVVGDLPPLPPPPKFGAVDLAGAWAPGGFQTHLRTIEVRHRANPGDPWGEWQEHSRYANQFNLDDALLALVDASCEAGVSRVVEYREAPWFVSRVLIAAAPGFPPAQGSHGLWGSGHFEKAGIPEAKVVVKFPQPLHPDFRILI